MGTRSYVVGTRSYVVGTRQLCRGNEILCRWNEIKNITCPPSAAVVLVCHILVLCLYIVKGVTVHFTFHVCHGKSIFLNVFINELGVYFG